MQLDIDFIISPVMGAIIAGSANRVAIKMLFFPANPWYVFGVRIPFTPGIIPKERVRIAESIGKAAGEHILNSEGLIGAVKSEPFQQRMYDTIQSAIHGLKESPLTISEALNAILGSPASNAEPAENSINQRVTDTVMAVLANSPDTSNHIRSMVSSGINSLSANSTRLSEMLTTEQIEHLNKLITDHAPQICNTILDYLHNESISTSLQRYLDSSLNQHMVGRLMIKFISPTKIYGYLSSELERFLTSEDGCRQVAQILANSAESLLNSRVCDICDTLELQKNESSVKDFICHAAEQLLSPDSIKPFVTKTVDALMDIHISQLSYFNEEQADHLSKYLVKTITLLVEKHAGNFAKFVDISKIVRDRINDFDIEQMEDLILNIVKKDLWALTFLEASLGFLIGFLTPLLGYLFRML